MHGAAAAAAADAAAADADAAADFALNPAEDCTLDNLQATDFNGVPPINCRGQTLEGKVSLPDMSGDKVDFTGAKLTVNGALRVEKAVGGKFRQPRHDDGRRSELPRRRAPLVADLSSEGADLSFWRQPI